MPVFPVSAVSAMLRFVDRPHPNHCAACAFFMGVKNYGLAIGVKPSPLRCSD